MGFSVSQTKPLIKHRVAWLRKVCVFLESHYNIVSNFSLKNFFSSVKEWNFGLNEIVRTDIFRNFPPLGKQSRNEYL